MANLPNPENRLEYFLRKIIDKTKPCPPPETREEQYLDAIAEKSLPDTAEASAGNVLILDEDKAPAWSAPSGGLPDASEASAGDVLTLDEDKAPAWSTPSGGGGGLLILDETNLQTIDGYLQEHQLPDNLYIYDDDSDDWLNLFDDYENIVIYTGDPEDLATRPVMIKQDSSPGPR